MQLSLARSGRLLQTYLAPLRGGMIALTVLLLGSIAVQLFSPQLLRAFIDAATTAGTPASRLTAIAGLFIGLALLQQLLEVVATYVGETVGWTATNSLRADLTRHCLRLDLTYHKAHTPGELIERIDGDVTTLAGFFSRLVIQVAGNLLLLAGVMVLLWLEDWRVGLALTTLTLIVLVGVNRMRAVAVPYWARARQASADLFGFLEERLAGIEDIRGCGAQEYIMQRLEGAMGQRLAHERRARFISGVVWSIPLFVLELGIAAGFALSAWLVAAGGMTIGAAFLVYAYARLIFRPIMHLAGQLQDFQRAGAGIVRVEALLATPSAVADGPGAPLPAGPLAVTFEQVSFAYDEAEIVLRDLSFRLAPGRVLGLLGRTGSGKTTVTRLLFRLYDPAAGAIRLGDVELRAARLTDLRRRIGLVTQEVQLFHANVRDNLTFFDTTIGDERIIEALVELELIDWLRTQPAGLDTMLGPGGGGLSAGEAQLLAFARVFLRDPGLVILDEASSRLDPATEARIERAVERLLRDRTGIIIAHRLATVQRADEILILDDGRLVEHGPRLALAADPTSRLAGLLKTGLQEVLV